MSMFTHLQELLSFETAPAPEPTITESENTNEQEVRAPGSQVFSMEEDYVEEPMEEIALEVTRSGGIIEPPPPPGSQMISEEDSVGGDSSGAVVGGEEKKRGIFSSWSKSKSNDEEAVAAVPVKNSSRATDVESDISSGDGDYDNGKAVGVSAVSGQDKVPMSSYRYKKEANKKAWLICIAVLLLIVAVVVPTAIVVPRNRSTETAAAAATESGNDETGNDETGDEGSDTNEGGTDTVTDEETTPEPTAAPTDNAASLPQECQSAYDNLDSCLLNEVTSEEAEGCIDCVWSFLPDNSGPCASLQQEVCNILGQCECLSCADELEEYLDCQSDCSIDCSA